MKAEAEPAGIAYTAVQLQDIAQAKLALEEIKAYNEGESAFATNVSVTTGDDDSATLNAKEPGDVAALRSAPASVPQSLCPNCFVCKGSTPEANAAYLQGMDNQPHACLPMKLQVKSHYADLMGLDAAVTPDDWRRLALLLNGADRGWTPAVANSALPQEVAFQYEDVLIPLLAL